MITTPHQWARPAAVPCAGPRGVCALSANPHSVAGGAVSTSDGVDPLLPRVLLGALGFISAAFLLGAHVEVARGQCDAYEITKRQAWDTYTGDSFTSMGIDFAVAEWVAVVRDGNLQSYSWTMTDESLAALMAAMPPQVMPVTGGTAVPLYALVAVSGALICVGGLRLGVLRWNWRRTC